MAKSLGKSDESVAHFKGGKKQICIHSFQSYVAIKTKQNEQKIVFAYCAVTFMFIKICTTACSAQQKVAASIKVEILYLWSQERGPKQLLLLHSIQQRNSAETERKRGI